MKKRSKSEGRGSPWVGPGLRDRLPARLRDVIFFTSYGEMGLQILKGIPVS